MSEQPQGPVAPADARDEDVNEEGVHPILVNPDQPSFPAPIGVDRADLEEAGVAHGYHGGPDEQAEVEETPEEEGAGSATTPEGKPADPDAEEKAKKLAEQAAKAQQASGQKPQGQGGQQG